MEETGKMKMWRDGRVFSKVTAGMRCSSALPSTVAARRHDALRIAMSYIPVLTSAH
jgi:hypothetical protein